MTMPLRAKLGEAEEFAIRKEHWLREKLAERPVPTRLDIGATIPIDGIPREIIAGTGRTCRLDASTIAVPGTNDRIPARLKVFLKDRARAKFLAASTAYAGQVGREFTKITLRDTRSRWGSCTATGNLMYSWRLIMAPSDVLEYVAAHEVSHLVELNHSPAFWGLVQQIYGDHAAQRKWLRNHGAKLHAMNFTY